MDEGEKDSVEPPQKNGKADIIKQILEDGPMPSSGKKPKEAVEEAPEPSVEEAIDKDSTAEGIGIRKIEVSGLTAEQQSKPVVEEIVKVKSLDSQDTVKPTPKPVDTVIIENVVAEDKNPQTPKLGKISDDPIEIIHSIGDLHGWAPGLISYLINNKLATIEIDGYPLQDEKGILNDKNLKQVFPNPIKTLKQTNGQPAPAGLAGQPGHQLDTTGLNGDGHGKIKARWIAEANVALIQVGDVYDRADHSELAAEILRQLIIDAPGKVFVMVGNHEQFMLENDYDNWYFNEVRNAWTDRGSLPQSNSRNHFRFLPGWDGKTKTERADATFRRYIDSTWTLFLTQGAVMQKLGWIDEKIDLEPMLGEGWAGYYSSRDIRQLWEADGGLKQIPGALTALVIGDTLFHHAEPAAHRTDEGQGLETPLPQTMTSAKSKSNNILFRMYTTGGGSLKNSPDAPLLWSRGSSTGASSGNPAAESHLEGLANAWQGLRRIVHGHTPTVGSGDFDSVTSGKSTTVSYLGDSLGRQSTKGRANRIRIYNIDEGMSPAYYSGDESVYSPNRMPTGLRLEKDEFSPLESKSQSSQHLKINPSHSINEDSRNLWKWSAGEWRNSSKPNWGHIGPIYTSQLINHGNWSGFISTATQSGASTRSLLDRNINATQIGKLMIEKMLQGIFSEKPSVRVESPKTSILQRVTPVGSHIASGNLKKAWNEIDTRMIIVKQDKDDGHVLICLNSTNQDMAITLQAVKGQKAGNSNSKLFKAKTITKISISASEKLFISSDSQAVERAIKEWIEGKDGIHSSDEPVLAHFSKQSHHSRKLTIKEIKVVNLILAPRTPPPPPPPPPPKKHEESFWDSTKQVFKKAFPPSSLGEQQRNREKQKRRPLPKDRKVVNRSNDGLSSQGSGSGLQAQSSSHASKGQPKNPTSTKKKIAKEPELSGQGTKKSSHASKGPPKNPTSIKKIEDLKRFNIDGLSDNHHLMLSIPSIPGKQPRLTIWRGQFPVKAFVLTIETNKEKILVTIKVDKAATGGSNFSSRNIEHICDADKNNTLVSEIKKFINEIKLKSE